MNTTVTIQHNGAELKVTGTYHRAYAATLEQPGEDESFSVHSITDSGIDVTDLHDADNEISGLALEAYHDLQAFWDEEAADAARDDRLKGYRP